MPERPAPLVRERASRRELIGRLFITWCSSYAALRLTSGVAGALAQAVLVAVLWELLHHRITQAFRAMTFVAGPFVISLITSAWGVAVLAACTFLAPPLGFDRSSVLAVGLATLVAGGVWDAFVRRAATAPARVLVVGGGSAVGGFLAHIDEANVPLQVVGVVDDVIDPAVRAASPFTAPLEDLSETVRGLSPDLVVIAVQRGRPEVFGQLLQVAETGFQIAGLPEIYEFTFGRLPIEELTPAWFMSVLHAYNRPANRLGKRLFDIVVALLGIVLALPLVPVIVVVVKRTSGPLLYRQQRLGEHGRMFTMLKFRSMRTDAEAAGAQWAAKDDDRVIPGGRLMRLLRLDELPQLWNVLRSEMSIVGPRPERPEFLEYLSGEVPFWSQRHLLRPGITGWAQIRSSYAADTMATIEKLSYDLWYLRHRNVLLDALICVKTLPRMATFRGAR
jgi:exopolysaccharide biosynthesis polyprenyl glycosylphosphotransferase